MKTLLTLFLLPLCVFAQIKIEGKVVDAVTKQPIPYVNLESFKYKIGTQSNQDGVFTLELPQGKLSDTIKISCVGYAAELLGKSLELVATKKNAWNEFDISDYQVKIPKKGFYVAIEWLANEKFGSVSHTFREVVNVNGKKRKVPKPFTYYGPEIGHSIDSSYGLTYRKFLGSDWHLHRAGRVPKEGDRNKTGFADVVVKATIEVVE